MLGFPTFTFLIFSWLLNRGTCQNEDYWSDDFDPGQNCEKPDKIAKLLNMKPSQCKLINGESDEQAFSICKTHLTSKLQKKCEYSKEKCFN